MNVQLLVSIQLVPAYIGVASIFHFRLKIINRTCGF